MSTDRTHSQQQDENKDPTLGAPPTDTLNKVTELKAPIGGQQRSKTIRLIVPPKKFGSVDFRKDVGGAIARIIKEVAPSVAEIEVLMHPSPIGFVIVLQATPYRIDGRSMNQQTLTSFRGALFSGPQNKLLEAAQRFTEGVSIETGRLVLDPIGISNVTTSRLLLDDDNSVGYLGKHETNPLEKTLMTLKNGHEPFIYQLIVSESKSGYNASVRLATYHPRYTYSGNRGFAKIAEKGHRMDLARPFSHLNFTSNFNLDTDKYWKTVYNRRIDGSVKYKVGRKYTAVSQYKSKYAVRKEAATIKRLTLGKDEHTGLKNGNASYNTKAYKNQDLHGWFSIDASQLPLVAKLVPLRMTANPWKNLEERSAPKFDTADTIRGIDPTIHRLGIGWEKNPQDEPDVQNEGKVGHLELERFIRQWFRELGDQIKAVEQTTESVPDQRLITDDGLIHALGKEVDCEIVPVEAESTNSDKGANTLVNAERALARNRHVIFVYKNEKKAKRGYGHLYTTYREKTDFGVWWYNDSDPVRCPDGRIPALKGPSSTTRAVWETNPAGTHRLSVGDETIITGEPGQAVEDFEYEYYYREDNGTHRIETKDGELVEKYAADSALKANWTRLAAPHLALDLTYGQFCTVMYRDTDRNELKLYNRDPEWMDDYRAADGTIDKLTVAMEQFHNDFIVEHEDSELRYSDLRERFRSYCEQWLDIDSPADNIIGKTLPEEFKKTKTGATDNKYQYFDGYTFRFPVDLKSPDDIDLGDDISETK